MSFDEGIDKGDKPTFKWGKKRCMGGTKRSIPFYESFTYDEIEYFLYDCVYLYKDGEAEPYIGKLIKIWEQPNGEKKIKVLWFFHPVEICNYLRDNIALEKELFLASGEGVGLVNTNPLEAIAGKCNVVCVSKDKRNPQPSEEEIKTADFIFFRTFDVGKLLISDVIEDKIAGQDVSFIFNKKRPETSNILKSEATAKDNNVKFVASNAAQLLSKLDLEGNNKDVGKDAEVVRASSSVAKDVDSKASLLNSGKHALDELCSDDNNAQRKKFRVDDDKNSIGSLAQSDDRAKLKPGDKNGKDSPIQSDDRAKPKHGNKNDKDSLAQSDDKGKLKPVDDLVKLDSRLFKKAKVNDNSSKPEVLCNIYCSIVSDNDKASQAPISSSEDKLNAIPISSSIRGDRETSKRVKLDEKKTKLADESLEKLSAATPDKEIKSNGQAMEVSRMPDVATNNQNASEVPMSCVEGKSKPIIASSLIGRDKGTSKKAKLDAKKTKLVDESVKKSSEAAPEKDIKTQAVEFNRRPDAVNINDKDSKVPLSNTEAKLKSSTVSSLTGQDMGTSKKVKPDERKTVLAGESSQKTSVAVPDKDIKSQTMEVTRRPEADRSKWFKGVPWEERLEDAHKQGTLVLLENLDPSYTSSEIQDIIWHAFGLTCTAKVVQHTMISSPHSGRALTIFKQKDAAETVVRRLEEGCLMLSDGRPLVGSRIPVEKGKQSQFFGHLVIDKIKFQMQRDELKKAVSTSHCSQPNTIEYEMAMDWKLLQLKSDIWWKDLHKQHGGELRKLGSGLRKK